MLTWIREGVSAIIPQFSLIQDVARNVGAEEEEEDVAEMPVVLVPTDAGWALGLLLEEEGDWHAVFLPGAPQMSSGSVAYAHTDQIHRTGLTLKELWVMLRARGKGSSAIYKQLAMLQAAGKLRIWRRLRQLVLAHLIPRRGGGGGLCVEAPGEFR